MHLRNLLAGLTVAALLAPAAASAAPLYENVFGATNGNCLFSSTCAAQVGSPQYTAAQSFTLSSAATVESASFVEYDLDVQPTEVQWSFLADDGFGAPGSVVASGSSAVLGFANVAPDQFGYRINQVFFDISSVNLAAGSYFFALSATSPVFETYLAAGAGSTGAFQSNNGGASWSPGYQDNASIAVALFDNNYGSGSGAVPEPATWALMIGGFGMAGATLRRRRTAAA